MEHQAYLAACRRMSHNRKVGAEANRKAAEVFKVLFAGFKANPAERALTPEEITMLKSVGIPGVHDFHTTYDFWSQVEHGCTLK